MEDLLRSIISKLDGKKIVKVIAGGSNGSMIVFDIGDSEFSLFIKCVWRLEEESMIITGWNESNDPTHGNMTKQIKELTGDVIKTTEVNTFFDLKLHFLTGKILNVFCDVTPNYEPDDYDENWVICDIKADVCYTISKNFKVITSSYQ